jgi:hypothetical protein
MKKILKTKASVFFAAAVVFISGGTQKPATPGNETMTLRYRTTKMVSSNRK